MEDTLAVFDEAVLEEKATWRQMELPAGDVFFGEVKAKMLGYEESDFSNCKDFTKIVNPDDYEITMKNKKL